MEGIGGLACGPASSIARACQGRVLCILVLLALAIGGAEFALAVDANHATAEQLEELRGIGPAISARILEERTRGGAFRDMDDLRERVKGIGVANLKKFAAAGLRVTGGAGAGKKAGVEAGAAAAVEPMRQAWMGRSGVVYYDPRPEVPRAAAGPTAVSPRAPVRPAPAPARSTR